MKHTQLILLLWLMVACGTEKKMVPTTNVANIPCMGDRFSTDSAFVRATGKGEDLDGKKAYEEALEKVEEQLKKQFQNALQKTVDANLIDTDGEIKDSSKQIISKVLDRTIADGQIICNRKFISTKNGVIRVYLSAEVSLSKVCKEIYEVISKNNLFAMKEVSYENFDRVFQQEMFRKKDKRE